MGPNEVSLLKKSVRSDQVIELACEHFASHCGCDRGDRRVIFKRHSYLSRIVSVHFYLVCVEGELVVDYLQIIAVGADDFVDPIGAVRLAILAIMSSLTYGIKDWRQICSLDLTGVVRIDVRDSEFSELSLMTWVENFNSERHLGTVFFRCCQRVVVWHYDHARNCNFMTSNVVSRITENCEVLVRFVVCEEGQSLIHRDSLRVATSICLSEHVGKCGDGWVVHKVLEL